MTEEAKCPVDHVSSVADTKPMNSAGTSNNDWWPEVTSLEPLLHNSPKSNPMDTSFNYAREFSTLDLDEVKKDIVDVMKDSQPWWPADFGHYGPFFIRMAWHSAGTYRVQDGRGGGGEGLQRFAPLNSWPDNVNLDKARRLLWPVKKKYGRKLSWADLMILAGNVALEDMGFKTWGFAGGREDVWEPDNTYWGTETEWLASKRYHESREADTLEDPLAAVQMGLIYVNPEGPDGNPDFKASAADIRTTFARMAMNDEETVALIAGGHAFGKTHGAGDAAQVGPEPEAVQDPAAVGLGWANSQGKGHSEDTISSGLEVTWTPNPIKWDNDYLRLIYKYQWMKSESPAGAVQWEPLDCDEEDMAPHAHLPGVLVKPKMLTTDLALRFGDDEYDKICKKFLEDFDYFSETFAKAWFKLTHRDMGPTSRYYGSDVPTTILDWQEQIPKSESPMFLSSEDAETITELIINSKTPMHDFIKAAWASASTYRKTDKRGGANGGRILLEPYSGWAVNEPEVLGNTLNSLNEIRVASGSEISMSDLIVFAGKVAIDQSFSKAGIKTSVRYVGGRGQLSQEKIDQSSANHLRPIADGFRNWVDEGAEGKKPENLLIEKAALLGLTPPEMTALVGGMRALGASVGKPSSLVSDHSQFSNEFFVNLLDMNISWKPVEGSTDQYAGHDRETGEQKFTATRVDLIFASHSVLRALAEVYASDDGLEKLASDFAIAWNKVMMLDRFDIA